MEKFTIFDGFAVVGAVDCDGKSHTRKYPMKIKGIYHPMKDSLVEDVVFADLNPTQDLNKFLNKIEVNDRKVNNMMMFCNDVVIVMNNVHFSVSKNKWIRHNG